MKKLIYAAAALVIVYSSQAHSAATGATAAARPAAGVLVLKKAKADATAVFARIDSGLAKAARGGSQDADKTLAGLCSSLPAASCSLVDDKGKIIAIFPAEYKNLVGSDISKQDHMAKLLKTHKPVMGEVFTSLQGFAAVGIYHPVFSKAKKFSGGVGILVKPEVLLSGVLSSSEGKGGFNFWVMDRTGRLLYDPDVTQIGRVLSTDPIYIQYEKLQALVKKIAVSGKGEGEYEYFRLGSSDVVSKQASWDTIGLYGAQWRLVAITPKRLGETLRDNSRTPPSARGI